MNPLLLFIFRAMEFLVPNRDHTVMANAIHDVIINEAPLFQSDVTREKTALLVATVAYKEGTLREDVVGDCTDASGTKLVCEAHGAIAHSYCSMQVHDSMGGSSWLNENPYQCIKRGLFILRASLNICPEFPIAFYASGPKGCENRRARRISNDRMNTFEWLWSQRVKFRTSHADFDIVHPSIVLR